jgi:hypothetical protein
VVPQLSTRLVVATGSLCWFLLCSGCHTFEVRQFDSVKKPNSVRFERAAVMMRDLEPTAVKHKEGINKLFSEQLIVSLQKRGIDVAERQKVESLLVDAELIRQGMADLTETERAKRLGRLLKADIIIYADTIVSEPRFTYYKRAYFNSEAERFQLEQEANTSGVVKRNGYPVLASHAIGLSMRAVDTATGEIVWVGYRFLGSAKWVDDQRPETLTSFDVIRGVCDEIIDDLLIIRKA